MSQKIIYMGRPIRESNGRYSSVKKMIRKLTRWTLKWSFRFVVGYALLVLGIHITPKTIQVVAEAQSNVPPIMQRIAKCETNNQHYGKSGQVLMTGNTNKTVDVGRYAINSVWFPKATEMGLDLTDEKDNEKFALWIYENRGTGDWYPSQHCWKK